MKKTNTGKEPFQAFETPSPPQEMYPIRNLVDGKSRSEIFKSKNQVEAKKEKS